MDVPASALPAAPAVVPPPLPYRCPRLRDAAGMIALYFALQAAIGLVVAVLLGFGMALLRLGPVRGIEAMLTRADVRSAMVIAALLCAGGVALWLAHRLWPQAWSLGTPSGIGFARPTLPWVLLAVALGLAMPLLGGWLTDLLARGHAVPQDVKELGSGIGWGLRLALTLVVVSIGPLVEELLFRGLLLSALLRRLHAAWAVPASAAVFALVHLPDLHWLWYAVPNLALLGVALAWLRLRSGSLWPAVIAHGCNNLLAMLVLFASLGQG